MARGAREVAYAICRAEVSDPLPVDFQLLDVYQVVGYYMKHADELAEYFENRAREEEWLLSSDPEWSPKGLRDRVLARQNAR